MSRPRNAVSGITMTVAMTKPVEIHVISSSVAPTEPRMCSMATFTMDESMAPISVPNVTDTVTSHLLTGLRATAGAAAAKLGTRLGIAVATASAMLHTRAFQEEVDEVVETGQQRLRLTAE